MVDRSTAITRVGERLASGARLTEADIELLLTTRDLTALGTLADDERRRRHGNRTTFVRVAAIEVADEPIAPWVQLPVAAREVRVCGRPGSLDCAVAFVRSVAQGSHGIPVSGFSLADLEALCAAENLTLVDVLRRLREAGIERVAEAPVDRLADAETAFRAAETAALPVTRATIQEAVEGIPVDLFRRVVALQETFGTFRVFAPLPRNLTGAHPSTGYDNIRQVALARLLVDNIESIQVDWSLYGPKLAQVALTFGADDLDSVSAFDTHEHGARRAPLEEVRRNIRAASFVPVERTIHFEDVEQ